MKISRSLMVLGLLLVMLVLPIMASGSDTLLAEPTVPVSSAVPSLPSAISAQAAIVTDDVGQVLWSVSRAVCQEFQRVQKPDASALPERRSKSSDARNCR